MSAVPTVARWWKGRTDPQRIELYTRWSFYGWLALTPLLSFAVLGSAQERAPTPAVTLFVLGSVAVTATSVLLARGGLVAHSAGGPLPRGPAAAAVGAAVVTSMAGVLAFLPGPEDGSALAWGVAMPLSMVLTAASSAWDTRRLVRGGLGIGGAAAAVVVAAGAPAQAAASLGVVIFAAVTGLALAFRFSVWVLDVVTAMERTRGVQLQLAVAEERLRFARDLHDVMGRNLSAIAVKSQLAAELLRRGRKGAEGELADISRVAEESLREVRDVVGGYRGSDLTGELAGARSVLRAAGVTCTVSGEEAGERLPDPAQTALGWVVREAVTNVLRHSRATTCTVALQVEDDEAELDVVNDGATDAPHAWGNGLTGLSERLAGIGGRLSARPEREGFRLVATVPLKVQE